jgi:hypothetical protein
MFGIASIVAFAVALILQLASVSKGAVLTAAAFTIIGLLCLAVHMVYRTGIGGTPWNRGA